MELSISVRNWKTARTVKKAKTKTKNKHCINLAELQTADHHMAPISLENDLTRIV